MSSGDGGKYIYSQNVTPCPARKDRFDGKKKSPLEELFSRQCSVHNGNGWLYRSSCCLIWHPDISNHHKTTTLIKEGKHLLSNISQLSCMINFIVKTQPCDLVLSRELPPALRVAYENGFPDFVAVYGHVYNQVSRLDATFITISSRGPPLKQQSLVYWSPSLSPNNLSISDLRQMDYVHFFSRLMNLWIIQPLFLQVCAMSFVRQWLGRSGFQKITFRFIFIYIYLPCQTTMIYTIFNPVKTIQPLQGG